MTPSALVGWGFIAIALAIFADIDATAEVAQAFAWLVLIAVLFHSGPAVFTQFQAVVGGKA